MRAQLTIFFITVAGFVSAQSFNVQWRQADTIARTIERGRTPPGPGGSSLISINDVRDKDATQVINEAIVERHRAGGGRIVFLAGEYVTGQIEMLSDVRLFLTESAVLRFRPSSDKDQQLIYARQQSNISITGRGTLVGHSNAPISVFEGCRNVLIDGVRFDRGGDNIVIRSTEDIVIRNVTMRAGDNGIVITNEMPGNSRNVFFENGEMNSRQLQRMIHVKSDLTREGVIENIFVRNINLDSCSEAILHVEMRYDDEETEVPTRAFVRNIFVENVTGKSSNFALLVDGFSEGRQVDNIVFKDCLLEGIKDSGLNKIVGAVNVSFVSTTITSDPEYKIQGSPLRGMSLDERRRLFEERHRERMEMRRQMEQNQGR